MPWNCLPTSASLKRVNAASSINDVVTKSRQFASLCPAHSRNVWECASHCALQRLAFVQLRSARRTSMARRFVRPFSWQREPRAARMCVRISVPLSQVLACRLRPSSTTSSARAFRADCSGVAIQSFLPSSLGRNQQLWRLKWESRRRSNAGSPEHGLKCYSPFVNMVVILDGWSEPILFYTFKLFEFVCQTTCPINLKDALPFTAADSTVRWNLQLRISSWLQFFPSIKHTFIGYNCFAWYCFNHVLIIILLVVNDICDILINIR